MGLTFMGENSTSGFSNLSDILAHVKNDTWARLSEYIIAEDWKQPKFPWIKDYLNKLYDNHTRE